RRAIPFTIADRAARAGSTIPDAFLRLLDLAGSRFGAAAVLDLLEPAAIQRRFELTESDVQTIRAWVRRAGVRWGIDAAHRAELGLPSFDEATWRFGLRRLLLGYALPGDGRTLFDGILPDREIEGSLAVTLGRLLDFLEELFSRVRALRGARPLEQWEPALRATLDAFFLDHDDFADELRRVREVFGSLGQIARDAAFDAPVEFEVIRAHLTRAFAEEDSGPGFLAGRVTFCALKPMRSIPFKVIGLLGMNDGAFPRHETLLAFDLAAQHPQPGDRTLREDDRYLFLETLLSARQTLYLSYSGLSQRERAASPPSVIVSELLDYLESNFALAAIPLREHLVTQHRLQPFSPAHFAGDSRLFSYSMENWRASQSSLAPRHPPPLFGEQPLPEPDLTWRLVDLDRLARFFTNPARVFVRDRLGVRLPDDEPPLDDREPIELDALGRYELRQEAAAHAFAHVPAEVALPLTRAAGKLPPAFAGATLHHELRAEADQLAAEVQPHLAGDPLPPLTVDLPLGDWHLRGTLHQLRPNALLEYRAADLRAKDRLRAWIHHLALNAVNAAGYPRTTLVFAHDKQLMFGPVDDAREQLAALLEIYGRGLRQPLRFFPETSWKFAELTRPPGTSRDPVEAARYVWHSEMDSERSESRDPHFHFCFHNVSDPLDAEWEELACAVFHPMGGGVES
ncbi:MAG: exodeoxyribonuclease V subunit gamma, partial [Verrucomicrobiota bacterium]|nr:exodeoxyribonuclease V subunit gamma [Verrucomicrobiota bacterium]